MPEGFPVQDSKKNKETYTFRFPKFEKSLSYDPLVSYGVQQDVEGGSNIFVIIVVVIIAMVIVGGLAVFFLRRGKNSDTRGSHFIEN